MKRPTIRDIARAAGVSPTAVSFALNGKPGISTATRERILATANAMGWTPNPLARALSISRAHAVGLVIPRPKSSHSSERFFFNFMLGLQGTLAGADLGLVTHMSTSDEDELEVYRRWWGQRRVDGVIALDPRHNDPRDAFLHEIGMPAVFVGDVLPHSGAVIGQDAGMMTVIAEHLHERGKTSWAYVCGRTSKTHIRHRVEALTAYAQEHGVTLQVAAETEFTEHSGYIETNRLLASTQVPQAFIYENEILALGGIQALTDNDVKPGRDVFVVSCEDSAICRIVTPAISAIDRDPSTLGQHAAQVLVDMLEGAEPYTVHEGVPHLIVRASSAGNRD
ncbi:LacI family DNA-binding transcriptional regulator [Schaalia sp. Marseille-Q2122]|uniref:LacI family DNA-binding transcriptional regulator n=1 Tax=Schaalia sp. Marseille-Q2122 TaxID=2736604 RepID=UPI00158C99AC|nr:LacI family DNA-binding transcriptional regulator [Schaalia sp. Marseille-Q2122]